mgnify:FL=1|jgi:hypothetical protein
MSYKLNWRIKDKKVAEDFQKWVQAKHGKKRGAVGEELTKALNFWLKINGSPELLNGNGKLRTRKEKNYEDIIKNLELENPHGKILEQKELRKLISSNFGVYDDRAINGKLLLMEGAGHVQQNEDKTVSLFPDKLKGDEVVENHLGEISIPNEIKEMITDGIADGFIDLKQHGQVGSTFKIGKQTYNIQIIKQITINELKGKNLTNLGFDDSTSGNIKLDKIYNGKISRTRKDLFIHLIGVI